MIGTTLGSYSVQRELGRGGMGAVYVGMHALLGRPAAIKVLLPELSQNQEIVQRFFNEARAATAVKHPGIVEIYDFGYAADGSAYIVMEHLAGEPLTSRIARGRLAAPQALAIARQIAGALGAAHDAGIIHRDLKPDNVFLVPDPEVPGGERIKLLDFGIAKLAGNLHKTVANAVMGTPTYMSPEQCRGSAVDHRTDLYALGIMLFEMVCGRLPFEGDLGPLLAAQLHSPPPPPRSLAPDLPPPVEHLILRLLAKSPDERPARALDVALEIAGLLGIQMQGNVISGAYSAAGSSSFPAAGGSAAWVAQPGPGGPGPASSMGWMPAPTTMNGANPGGPPTWQHMATGSGIQHGGPRPAPTSRLGLWIIAGIGAIATGAITVALVMSGGGNAEAKASGDGPPVAALTADAGVPAGDGNGKVDGSGSGKVDGNGKRPEPATPTTPTTPKTPTTPTTPTGVDTAVARTPAEVAARRAYLDEVVPRIARRVKKGKCKDARELVAAAIATWPEATDAVTAAGGSCLADDTEAAVATPSHGTPTHEDKPEAKPVPRQPEPIDAEEHNRRGREAFGRKDLAAAILEFKAAYGQKADPRYLYNLAMAYKQSGDSTSALRYANLCMTSSPDAKIATKCQAVIDGK